MKKYFLIIVAMVVALSFTLSSSAATLEEGNVPDAVTVETFDGKTNEDVVVGSNDIATWTLENDMLKVTLIDGAVAGDWFQYGMQNKTFFSAGNDGIAFYVKNEGEDVYAYLRLDVWADGEQRSNLFLNVTEEETYVLYPADGSDPIYDSYEGVFWNGNVIIPAGFEGFVTANFDYGFIQEGTGELIEEIELEGLANLVFYFTDGSADTVLYVDSIGVINYTEEEGGNEPTEAPTAAPTEDDTAEGGCGGMVALGVAAVLIPAAIVLKKKR